MTSRAAAAFKAGVSAVALALAVTTAAPALAQAPAASGKSSVSAPGKKSSVSGPQRSSSKVFRGVKVSHSRPLVDTRIAVTGRTKGAERRVVLQVRNDRGNWRKVAVTRTRKNKFRFSYAVDSVRHRSFRVVGHTAPKAKRPAARGKRHQRTHGKLKSRRVVSRVVSIVPRAPVVASSRLKIPEPAPDPTSVFAAELRRAVDDGVRAYRLSSGVASPVATNECLSEWADGFAETMAQTNIFAHSPSSEWEGRIVSASHACLDEAPALIRQEAIAWEDGADPQEVADKVLQAWKDAWMHDEVLLDDCGHDRVMSVGVAKGDAAHGWYVVAVFGADS